MLKCPSRISKFTNLMDCMHTNLTFSTTSKGLSLKAMDFCTARCTTGKFPEEFMEAPLSEPFFTRRMKMFADPLA